jgi:hypothetical protein
MIMTHDVITPLCVHYLVSVEHRDRVGVDLCGVEEEFQNRIFHGHLAHSSIIYRNVGEDEVNLSSQLKSRISKTIKITELMMTDS